MAQPGIHFHQYGLVNLLRRIGIAAVTAADHLPAPVLRRIERRAPTAIGMKLACVGSISDEVLNMQEIAYHLLSYGKANYNQLFEARYGAVPQPDDERDNEIVLWMENIARQRGCLKRGAETDFDKVSAQITDDFRSGRIGKVSLEVPKQA